MAGANTVWDISLGDSTFQFHKGTHSLWHRLTDGEMIYTLLPLGQRPSSGDGGYFSINAAVFAKGWR